MFLGSISNKILEQHSVTDLNHLIIILKYTLEERTAKKNGNMGKFYMLSMIMFDFYLQRKQTFKIYPNVPFHQSRQTLPFFSFLFKSETLMISSNKRCNFYFSNISLKMGNLIAETPTIYTLAWTPLKNIDEFTILKEEKDIPTPIQGKILIPISKITQRRELVQQYHHHVVLVQDTPVSCQLARLSVRGVPLINEYDLYIHPSLCRTLTYDCQFCPIPLVLQRFHESYVKNYANSFHFYGIRVHPYAKVENYLKAECSNRYLVCSNYQLDQLSFKMKKREGNGDPSKKLTVLCFCNKEEYSLSKRIEIFLQREGIQVLFFQNILDIIQRVNRQTLTMPPELQLRTERVLFYLSDKQKDVEYLSKMVKRLQKSIRNVIVQKVNSKNALVSKVQKTNYSIVVVSSDSKEMRSSFELFEQLEKEGMDDRVIFLRRDNEISQKLTQSVYSLIEKPKYRKINILQKELIFFGPIQSFKSTLKCYPSLRFKKFIDSIRQKQKILPFLQIQTQVIITSLRLCPCQKQYMSTPFLSKVIYIRSKNGSTLKTFERRQSHSNCHLQQWFIDEQELLSFYSKPQNNTFLALNFHYPNRKMSYLGKTLNEPFSKMKQKKTILYNKLNDSMFLFSSQYYILDQLSTYILKYFSTKMLGNYQHQSIFGRVKSALYQQLAFLARNKRIEQAVIDTLQTDESQDVFELTYKVMSMLVQFPQFLQEVNSIWALFLYQDRKEHHTNCQVLLFLLFLAFNKTNFIKYNNDTLQGLTLIVKKSTTVYDADNLATFRNKNRNNFVYNVQFLACEVYQPGDTTDPHDILIKIEGSQLTSFSLYLPLWKKNKLAIICPFSKFEINIKPQRQSLLKFSVNSQQKLLQKFSQIFLEQNPNQLKLFGEDRQMRKFDAFLDSMSHSKFQTAGYLLKKVAKQQSMMNQECLNAFNVLYHLKRGELSLAQQKLKVDKYHDILSRVIKSLKEEGNEKGLIPDGFSSSKRIQQNNKEYQNLEETSNDNESFDSAMIQTDPNMIKQLSSDYRLLNPKFARGRSPSSKIKEVNRRKAGKVPIRRKQQLSISDQLSQTGKPKQRPMNIIILPPLKHLSSKEKQLSEFGTTNNYNSSTFGNNNKFMTEYSSMSSEKQKKSLKQQCGELKRMKSTRSQAGGRLLPFDDGVIESSPMLKKQNSKKSQFLIIQKEKEKCSLDSEQESRGQLISLIDPSQQQQENEQTAKFNFQTPKTPKFQNQQQANKSQSQEEIVQQMGQIHESIHEVAQEDSQSSSSHSNDDEFTPSITHLEDPNDTAKPFPIKKNFFKFPRKSLKEMHQNLNLLESPLRKIQEERSSQFSLSNSTAKFLLFTPQKQNNCTDSSRPKQAKLFTFYKISDPLKPRFSISSNKNSLNLSNTSELGKIDEKNEMLFQNFNEEIRSELSDLRSISSIDINQTEQVYPEEMVNQR